MNSMRNETGFPKLPWPEWKCDGLLGRGGFGEVYRIRREEYGNVSFSAAKIVKIPADESEIQELEANGISAVSYFEGMVDDLIKEISLMESLKGASNIVSIEDYKLVEKKNTIGWILYIRMELLTNLNQYRKDHLMEIEEILKLGCDICSALEACRKKGIVHRDIKPSNILVSEFGDFKLGDFGISRNLSHTMSGLSRKGTDLYMAPEVYRGDRYNSTVDLYSLGLVLYSLLNNGRLPFFPKAPADVNLKASENAFSRRIMGEVFPDPEFGGKEIGDILRKACDPDPKKRYQTASEMKSDISSCHRYGNSIKISIQKEVELNSEKTQETPMIDEDTNVTKWTRKNNDEKKQDDFYRVFSLKFRTVGIALVAECTVVGGLLWCIKSGKIEPKDYITRSEVTSIPEISLIPTVIITQSPEPSPSPDPTPSITPTPIPSLTPIPEQPSSIDSLKIGVSLIYPYDDEKYHGFWKDFGNECEKRDYDYNIMWINSPEYVADQYFMLSDMASQRYDVILIEYSDPESLSDAVLKIRENGCIVFGLNVDSDNSSGGEDYSIDMNSNDWLSDERDRGQGFLDLIENSKICSETDAEAFFGTENADLNTNMQISGRHHAEIVIKDYGEIDVELYADVAPITVSNFIKLAKDGFYDSLTFHRIVDGFMMQGGDPLGNGTGGSEETIKGEFSENGIKNDLSHTRGAISMARSSDPDSASSQFFIVQCDSTFLDGQYAVFGYITDGLDIVDKICSDAKPSDDNGTIPDDEQPVIERVTIVD